MSLGPEQPPALDNPRSLGPWPELRRTLQTPRVLIGAALALALVSIWARPPPPVLYGVDAACYARVGRELAERPLGEWPRITLGGSDFYEHPPLAMWIESGFFRLAGVSAASAVLFARLTASLLVAAVLLVARRLADERAAAFSILGLPLLSAFLFESQNPMLELPLTVALTAATLGAVSLATFPVMGSILFAAGFTAGTFIKGPPALAVLPILVWTWWRYRLRWQVVALAVGLAGLLLALAVGGFEWARAERGLPPFFGRYLERQVLQSMVEGRHHPVHSPFYYLTPLRRWHLAGLLALPLAAWVWFRHRSTPAARLAELGALFAVIIVAGFSVPVQKYPWYIHPTMPGSAWMMGAVLATLLPARFDRACAAALAGVAVLFMSLVHLLPHRVLPPGQEMAAVHSLPAPAFLANSPRRIADCSALGDWKAMHLFAFLWNAERTGCDAPAAYRFDGQRLTATPP